MAVMKRSEGIASYPAKQLIHAAMEASDQKKGVASGILAAFLGACCLDDKGGDQRALELLSAYDELEELRPDLLALCLAYTAASDSKHYQQEAKEILDRAKQFYPNLQSERKSENHETDWDAIQKDTGITLLRETKELVVVSKPSGMVCYHGAHAKKGKGDSSLEQCLESHGVPLSNLNEEGNGFVHRIDRGTSGCLVLAKTNRMHALLVAQFFTRSIKKSYQALVFKEGGKLPPKGTINLDIDGRPATSQYQVMKRMGNSMMHIKVRTEQGRRHQVRKHCADGLGAPIVLDPLYGGEAIMFKSKNPTLGQHHSKKRFCLHADTLSIPEIGIHAKAPVPEWWQDIEESPASSKLQ